MNLLAALTTVASLLCALQICSVVSKSLSKKGLTFTALSPRIGFTVNSDVLDWGAAFKACKAQNSTLAFPKSHMEGEMMQAFLVDASGNTTKYIDIHLGFHSLFISRKYMSVQGLGLDEIGYSQWDPQSENNPSQRCGALTVDGMKTIDCDTRQQSVCEFKEGRVSFNKIDGFGYYQFHDFNLNWTDAIAICKSWNSNLLILRSTDEYDAVFDYYSKQDIISGSVDLLYGAHQLFAEHLFLTLFDELVEDSGYDVWAPGEPGDGTGVDFPYVGLRLTDSTTPDADAGMFLLPSDTPMWFICKRELH